MFKKFFEFILGTSKKDEKQKNEKTYKTLKESEYKIKNYMSEYETIIFERLQNALQNKYYVFPQINLASIVDKSNKSKYRTELFRNIDFGVFDKKTNTPLILIEVNDKTHNKKDRYERDQKVREIISKANIPLIVLLTRYDNTTEYIKKRLTEHLEL